MKCGSQGRPFRVDGGAVFIVLELMACFRCFPDHAHLSAYRRVKAVRAVRYGRAFRATNEVVKKSGRNPEEFALHSWRVGGAATLATGGAMSERVIQGEGRWKSDAYKAYRRNNIRDSTRASRKLAAAKVSKERQPGEGTIWGGNKRHQKCGNQQSHATSVLKESNGRVPSGGLVIRDDCEPYC